MNNLHLDTLKAKQYKNLWEQVT